MVPGPVNPYEELMSLADSIREEVADWRRDCDEPLCCAMPTSRWMRLGRQRRIGGIPVVHSEDVECTLVAPKQGSLILWYIT